MRTRSMQRSMERLPADICERVAACLRRDDLLRLRLVSKLWNGLCRRLIFKRIGVAKTYDIISRKNRQENSEHLVNHFYSAEPNVDFSREDYTVLCYEQLPRLSRPQFQNTIHECTEELDIYYDGWSTDNDDGYFYKIVTYLFTGAPVRKVRIWIEVSRHDMQFKSFQQLLSQFIPTAEFSLAIVDPRNRLPRWKDVVLDIDGMKITDLYISVDHLTPSDLPLWKEDREGGARARLYDLRALFRYSVAMSMFFGHDLFRSSWILKTIRYLHLIFSQPCRHQTLTLSDEMRIPANVEYLRITDIVKIEKRTYSPLKHVNLKQATGLKKMQYCGCKDIPRELTSVILQLKSTLEWLSIDGQMRRPQMRRPRSFFNFKDIATAGLGIKHLDLPISCIGDMLHKKRSSIGDFSVNFPELTFLGMALNDYSYFRVKIGCYDFTFLEELVSLFVRGSPRLAHIQLPSEINDVRIDESEPWAELHYRENDVLYVVDVPYIRNL